jgi:CRP-like cAMP-binding protein
MDTHNYLSNIFSHFNLDLPPEEIDRFCSILREVEYKKNSFFIREGDLTYKFGIIKTGLVRFYYNTYEGKEYNQTFKQENEFIMAYYPIMSGKPSPFSIQAVEECSILEGDYREFQKFYDLHPIWGITARKFYEYNFILKAEREAEFLLYNATDRYIRFSQKHPDLVKRLPQNQIALYLGINPVSLNRIIRQIKSED